MATVTLRVGAATTSRAPTVLTRVGFQVVQPAQFGNGDTATRATAPRVFAAFDDQGLPLPAPLACQNPAVPAARGHVGAADASVAGHQQGQTWRWRRRVFRLFPASGRRARCSCGRSSSLVAVAQGCRSLLDSGLSSSRWLSRLAFGRYRASSAGTASCVSDLITGRLSVRGSGRRIPRTGISQPARACEP